MDSKLCTAPFCQPHVTLARRLSARTVIKQVKGKLRTVFMFLIVRPGQSLSLHNVLKQYPGDFFCLGGLLLGL